MNSKQSVKNSNSKGRPKSSDKLKKKRDGTPDKPTTPNAQEIAEEDQRPASRAVLMNDEIASLAIKDEDLQRLREPHPPVERKKTPTTRSLMVKKVPPQSELDKPTPRTFTVAKPAPPNAPLKPVDLSGATGPRFGPDGKVLPYSILGNLEDYKREAILRGELQDDFEIPKEYRVSTPTLKYEKKKKTFTHPRMASVDENNALINWQKKMLDRKRQQGYISTLLQKPDNQLVMNQADTYRTTQEERYLIDRTIPFVDNGKGYRVGSEFWKQAEPVGNELTGMHMSLKQSERGYPPPIQHVGVPAFIKEEKGTRFQTRCGGVNYPWHKSRFLAERRKQLKSVMGELDPHKPEMDELQIVGNSRPYEDKGEQMSTEEPQPTTSQGGQKIESDPLANFPDVYPAPIFGPSVQFAGQPARWTGDDYSFKGEVGIEARVTFEAFSGERVTSFLQVKNDGTTSIYYNWKKLPKSNPFDLVNCKVQRFYFNTSSGVILPGDTMRFPFVFKSPNAGVFTEQWEFETKPVVCGGASLMVTLRGVALQEDKYKNQRSELEQELAHRQSTRLIEQIMSNIIEGIKTPDRARSPVDTYITEEEVFERKNPGMHYSNEVVKQLLSLHKEIFTKPEEETEAESLPASPMPVPEWDHSLDGLKNTILELDDEDERKEDLLQRLNLLVISLSFPPFTPSQHQMYSVGYQQLAELAENIVNTSHVLCNILGLPEKELEEEEGGLPTIQEEPDTNTLDITGRVVKRFESNRRELKSSLSKSKSGTKKAPEAKKSSQKDPKAPVKVAMSKEAVQKSSKETSKGTPKKPPSRAGQSTPLISQGDRSGAISPSSVVGASPIPESDPVLQRKYKDKLYIQTYSFVSEMFDRMSSVFEDIKNAEDTRNLERLKHGEI